MADNGRLSEREAEILQKAEAIMAFMNDELSGYGLAGKHPLDNALSILKRFKREQDNRAIEMQINLGLRGIK
jgi:uncharacterized protein YgfB (UPF0149 family)